MDRTLNYLKEIFGTNIKTECEKFYNAFPMYMTERYTFSFIKLPAEETTFVLVKPLSKQDININQIKKQIKPIYKYSETVPVFVFESSEGTFVFQRMLNAEPWNSTSLSRIGVLR